MGHDLLTLPNPTVAACTADAPGLQHDYRIHEYETRPDGPTRRSWRCVWCKAVACGNVGEQDPCWEPYHHHGDHRSRAGITWPLGGDR